MFRHDYYGLRDKPPVISTQWIEQSLLALWKTVQPGLAQRLQSEWFHRPERYHGLNWWWPRSSPEGWCRWWCQTQSVWLVWRALCNKGRYRPFWPDNPLDIGMSELAAEAPQLWYQWACCNTGSPVYPAAQQLIAMLRHRLRRFEQLQDIELEVNIVHSLADGSQAGMALMRQHWPCFTQALSRKQWLPVRVMPLAHPEQNIALLLLEQDAGGRLGGYEPISRARYWLLLDGQGRFWLESPNVTQLVHTFYPLAEPIARQRLSLINRLREWLGWR